jgi:hypothetical protein
MSSIENAKDMEQRIHNGCKAEKFERMIIIQNDFIAGAMKENKKSVVWIFSDKEYYHNDLEKGWFEEFEAKARKLYEEKGYKTKGIVITW